MGHGGDVANIIIGWILTFATYLCYAFQIVKIFQTKTARGLSFMSFWFCNITSFLNFLSDVVLGWPRLTTWTTTSEIYLSINQWTTLILFGSLFFCYFVIICQYMYYYLKENDPFALGQTPEDPDVPTADDDGYFGDPERRGLIRVDSYDSPDDRVDPVQDLSVNRRGDSDYPGDSYQRNHHHLSDTTSTSEDDIEEAEAEDTGPPPPEPRWKIILTILLFFGLLYLVVFLCAWGGLYLPIFGLESSFGGLTRSFFAEIVGYASAVIVFIQWLPQIIVTLLNRGAGSFSVVMLVFMMVGAVVNVVFLFVAHQNFANISSYIVSFAQQLILFGMLVFFATIDKCRKFYRKWRDGDLFRKKTKVKKGQVVKQQQPSGSGLASQEVGGTMSYTKTNSESEDQ